MIESEVIRSMGRKQTIKSREGVQVIIRLIGMGAFMTELANKGDTDRRPFVNGKRNPNFYTIKVGGHKVSLFGGTIGLLRAMTILTMEMYRAPHRPDKALAEAGRGLTGGWATLIWDNITGYDYSGRDAPFGYKRGSQEEYDPIPNEDQTGYWDNHPIDILKYIGSFALPITLGQVAGEIYGGIKSTAGQDWARVAGAGLGTVGEVGGFRIHRYSRRDEAEELAQERFDMSYEELTYHAQAEIDDLVTEKIGEPEQRGEKADYYARKQEIDNKLIIDSKSIANRHLYGLPTSTRYSPMLARRDMNEADQKHRRDIHGDSWSPEKQRMEGGILEILYDRDEEKEKPEKGTREFNLWQYGQTFVRATDPDTGEIDFDDMNKYQSELWAGLGWRTDPKTKKQVNEIDELLESIRIQEEHLDPRIQNMKDAGRFALIYSVNIDGRKMRYYNLDQHPNVIKTIMEDSEANRQAVQRYMNMSSDERKVFEKSDEGLSIGVAYGDALQEPYGVLWNLRNDFMYAASPVWRLAMYEAGFKHQDKPTIPTPYVQKNIGTKDWQQLYRDMLSRQ